MFLFINNESSKREPGALLEKLLVSSLEGWKLFKRNLLKTNENIDADSGI